MELFTLLVPSECAIVKLDGTKFTANDFGGCKLNIIDMQKMGEAIILKENMPVQLIELNRYIREDLCQYKITCFLSARWLKQRKIQEIVIFDKKCNLVYLESSSISCVPIYMVNGLISKY